MYVCMDICIHMNVSVCIYVNISSIYVPILDLSLQCFIFLEINWLFFHKTSIYMLFLIGVL